MQVAFLWGMAILGLFLLIVGLVFLVLVFWFEIRISIGKVKRKDKNGKA
jgi:hypothetical protein